MDKNAIKKYAVWARAELIARVSQKALQYGIEKDKIVDAAADSVHDKVLTAAEKKQRQALIAQIHAKGFEQVMEEVAYTWFNRFSALRFMEVNGYLPSHVRVFTDEENNFKPQIITEAIHLELDGLDMEKVYAYKEADKTEELFKYLLIVQCNALNNILPGMFQKIEDYTELLLPDNLLREGSVVEQLVTTIPEEDWKDAVQIIGWLYQYYNTEPKDKAFADLKKNIKISRDSLPAATQQFTPDWIVRYMVENSLGRLWINRLETAGGVEFPISFPFSSESTQAQIDGLKAEWRYYVDEAAQDEEVNKQIWQINQEYKSISPEDIRCIDPCMGSGHILVYMFDVLMQIYDSFGYTSREAVANILEKNLWGLDIDDRAAQLSYFAVMMKARQYDRRFFNRGIQPNVYGICESNAIDTSCIEYFARSDNNLKESIESIIRDLHDAKEYGSILNVSAVDFNALYERFEEIREDINIFAYPTLNELLPLVRVAKAMAQKYDVVVTNPPYRGTKDVGVLLSNFAKKNYPDSKGDLSTIFMERGVSYAKKHGYISMINIPIWMNKSTFTKLRCKLLHQVTIHSLLDFDRGVFGSDFGTVAFVFRNGVISDYAGTYLSLFRERGQVDSVDVKESFFHNPKGKYSPKQSALLKVPSYQIAYSYSNAMLNAISCFKPCDHYSDVKSGLQTGNNDLFLRLWFEVAHGRIGFNISSTSDAEYPKYKWFPHTKGGSYRKWYGNQEYILNWQNDGYEIKNYDGFGIAKNPEYYFEECLTWSHTSMRGFSVRYVPKGFIFNVEAPSAFRCSNNHALLGCLNSKIADYYFNASGSGLHYLAGAVAQYPVVLPDDQEVNELVTENIEISRIDWDAFETSWNFRWHPLILTLETKREASASQFATSRMEKLSLISNHYKWWEAECSRRFEQLKTNEERLNQIFIALYGLQGELTPDVDEKDITVRKADELREIKSLISYAVGCMFGRYSLDIPGLVYAGGEWDAAKYVTFPADKDSIILICDDEYFEDDIVGRFIKFVEVVYGEETLDENLRYIANVLGGSGTSKDVIRSYFVNDFYKDHCNMYQVTGSGKRPIYWLFDSGKKNGFKCLIYMHRYQPDTIARIRTDYVHEQQARYRTAIADLEQRISNASAGERVKLSKKLKTLQEQATEIHGYEEKIHHLADQMIRIDLDDGVKKNYEIFKDVLAKIK